ncbi:MAG: hypothetical protein J0H30_12055, partial [Alphaproteobacteria bacterium]|nr:hypothetical protein [Alphaproteobacteria bacterium]
MPGLIGNDQRHVALYTVFIIMRRGFNLCSGRYLAVACDIAKRDLVIVFIDADFDNVELSGLRFRRLEPLKRQHLSFDDGAGNGF